MRVKEKELVLWFNDVRKEDIPVVGGKNASLGEMINAGLPVPPGFAVTAYSYEKYIQEKRIAEQRSPCSKFTQSQFRPPAPV